MAFTRPIIHETVYISSYHIFDSETNTEIQSSSNSIKIESTYNNPNNIYGFPVKHKAIRFSYDDITSGSQYKNKYFANLSEALHLYITQKDPIETYWENSNEWYKKHVEFYIADSKYSPPQSNGDGHLVQPFDDSPNITLYCDETEYIFVKLFSSDSFTGTAYITIVGNNQGDNSPYKQVTWNRCDPEIKDILPASGSFVDDLNGFRISWTLDAPASAAGNVFMPTDIQFQWGTTQSLGNTITLTLDPNSPDSYRGVNIPAKTFPTSGTVYWKIRWKSELEDTYWETDVGTYSTTDSTAIVKPVYPVNASIDGEIDNVFQWEYETNTGLPQYAFDFQYSNNDGLSWENLFQHQESTSPSCTVPANTFIAGTGLWKVRGYNTDDVAGEWSETASIIVRAASKPPVISSVTTSPKVTITWQASGQQAFRLTAKNSTEIYESGIVFGTGKTFTIPHYWDDGELQIAISIENRFGVWSDEAKTAIIIQNTPSGNISLNGSVENYGAVLSWRTDATFKAYYVLRDGIAIACVTDTSYVDRNICGDAVYRVMGVTENGNYTESETLNLYSAPEHAVVGLIDGDDWIELRVNRGGMPEITETHMEDISYQYYSGRMYPVAYSSMFRERTKTFGFTVWKEASEKLQTMIGHLVVLKDYTGGKIIGVLNNLQLSGYVRRPDVSFDITVIDYSEEVSFDV